jgi:recombination protein RecR
MYEGPVQDLIDALCPLPSIGPRSANRIALHFILREGGKEDAERLASALMAVQSVQFCERCHNIAADNLCRICKDERRDRAVICVVGQPKDLIAIERIRDYRGTYHVLGGLISPIEGVGPDDLHIRSLLARLTDGEVTEVILATDPNLEGQATATYLARLLKTVGVKVTQLASGLPVGGDLDYADELTLGRAFEGRRVLST